MSTHKQCLKPHANGRNIVGQQLPTLLMLHVASVCTPCCMLLQIVGSYCTKFETRQTFSFKQNECNNSQQCWELLANNVVSIFTGHYGESIFQKYKLYKS